MRHFIALSLAAAVTLSCAPSEHETADDNAATAEAEDSEYRAAVERDEKLLSDGLRKVASAGETATVVTLYEIRNQFDKDYAALKDRPKVASYPILRKENLSNEVATELVRKLSSRDSYWPPTLKTTCLFNPHHALDIFAPSARVTAIICVECGDVELWVNGRSIGRHSFTDEANAELDALLRRLMRTPAT